MTRYKSKHEFKPLKRCNGEENISWTKSEQKIAMQAPMSVLVLKGGLFMSTKTSATVARISGRKGKETRSMSNLGNHVSSFLSLSDQ